MEDTVTNVTDFLARIIPYLSVLSVTVNCCHLVVLTRKSMPPTSMNTILIGIAVVDILAPMVYIWQGTWSVVGLWRGICDIPTYSEILSSLIFRAANEDLRRCSTWLGLSLAIIRTVSVKMASRKSFNSISESRFGVKVIIIAIFLSSLITISYLFRFQILQDDPHVCVTSSGSVVSTTIFTIVEFFNKVPIGGSARTVHILLTGIFGQLVPCFLFPTFAAILICELKKPDKKSSPAVRTEKISKMVIYMTVTFLVIEFPIGVGKMFNSMQTESTIPRNWNQCFNYFYVPITMFHCFICFRMSSQYRRTALCLIGFKNQSTVPMSRQNPSTYITSVNGLNK